jgi:cob(I)alamin adenosyltransferase
MGKRLTTIATRTGDAGMTGLGDGSRTTKDDHRIQAMGDVDELNSLIGVLICEHLPDAVREQLLTIQHDLFDLGGELCIPGYQNLKPAQVQRLDALLAQHNAALPRLENFILPGGSRAAAVAHLCRTVARRAERSMTTLGRESVVSELARQYINRLSDLMFVLARVLNRHAGGTDVLWDQHRNRELPDTP